MWFLIRWGGGVFLEKAYWIVRFQSNVFAEIRKWRCERNKIISWNRIRFSGVQLTRAIVLGSQVLRQGQIFVNDKNKHKLHSAAKKATPS
jgi:hypothetical protein